MIISDKLIAVATDPAYPSHEADFLAGELDLPRCDPNCTNYLYLLKYNTDSTPARLELHSTREQGMRPIFVDFSKGSVGFRIRRGQRNQEPLARAVGLKGMIRPNILDATTGLGRDAFILANLGCRVRAVERSPIIAALLRDGLTRALTVDSSRLAAERIHMQIGDAMAIMDRLADSERPDVIYLDPMYPHRSKSALVKKEMRLLRALVGDDSDAPQLLLAALRSARIRVVVKRPRLADSLPGVNPTHSLFGSTTRYDVYVLPHNNNG